MNDKKEEKRLSISASKDHNQKWNWQSGMDVTILTWTVKIVFLISGENNM